LVNSNSDRAFITDNIDFEISQGDKTSRSNFSKLKMSSNQTGGTTNIMEYSRSHLNSGENSNLTTNRMLDLMNDEHPDDEIIMRELTPRILEAETEDEDGSRYSKSNLDNCPKEVEQEREQSESPARDNLEDSLAPETVQTMEFMTRQPTGSDFYDVESKDYRMSEFAKEEESQATSNTVQNQ
jgi:hypothetical protein